MDSPYAAMTALCCADDRPIEDTVVGSERTWSITEAAIPSAPNWSRTMLLMMAEQTANATVPPSIRMKFRIPVTVAMSFLDTAACMAIRLVWKV